MAEGLGQKILSSTSSYAEHSHFYLEMDICAGGKVNHSWGGCGETIMVFNSIALILICLDF